IVDQHAVAERLRHVLELDDEIAEPLARRNVDLVGLIARLVFDRVQLLEAIQARLAFRLAPLRTLPNPFELALDRLAARLLAGLFLHEARIFLLEPRRVVALPRN